MQGESPSDVIVGRPIALRPHPPGALALAAHRPILRRYRNTVLNCARQGILLLASRGFEGASMDQNAQCMGTAFFEWQGLTLAYVAGIEALRRGDLGAATHLMRLSRELQVCEGALAQRSCALHDPLQEPDPPFDCAE